MATLFHIATAADWAAAQQTGTYTTSTRGRTLAEVGFVHCSYAGQWRRVREMFYQDATEPLVLLRIDPDGLDAPVVDEPAEPGGTETFPHVYGPIPVAAVAEVVPLHGRSFSAVYFREMFANALLLCLVLATGFAGYGVGRLFGDEMAPLLGALVGVADGIALSVLLYRRRA